MPQQQTRVGRLDSQASPISDAAFSYGTAGVGFQTLEHLSRLSGVGVQRVLSHTVVVVIPLYNGARFIADALRSVLFQTRQPDEIVVVDDGSTDESVSIATSIAGHVPSFRLVAKPNGGQSSARNLGVDVSDSSLIALLHQDDIWHPRHIEKLAEPFEVDGSEGLGWAYSNDDEIDTNGRLVARAFLDVTNHPKKDIYQCIREDMFILPGSSVISREVFDAVGGFDHNLIGYEDDDFFLRAFRAGFRSEFIDEPLTKWRIHTTSTSFTPRMSQSRLLFARKLIAEFPDIPERRIYLSRDLIAPRFVNGSLSIIYDCARLARPQHLKFAKIALYELIPYLRPRRRYPLRLMLPFLTNYHTLRILFRTGLLDFIANSTRRFR